MAKADEGASDEAQSMFPEVKLTPEDLAGLSWAQAFDMLAAAIAAHDECDAAGSLRPKDCERDKEA